jgi:polysaccharide export outer membrane protein
MKLICNSPIAATALFCALALVHPTVGGGQTPSPNGKSNGGSSTGVVVPPGYVIGTDDVLAIVFWRDKEMSLDVVVRPDGKISLPLVNDVQAAGYTPDQLRAALIQAATKYIAEPNATVVVKEIRSRRVFITGNVLKPGEYLLTGELNVLQLIALAGGLQEYADAKNIMIIRKESGREQYTKFNYKDVIKGKNVQQNLALKPGDTVVVP